MPTFEPTPEQTRLIEAASRVTEDVFRPGAAEADETGALPSITIE